MSRLLTFIFLSLFSDYFCVQVKTRLILIMRPPKLPGAEKFRFSGRSLSPNNTSSTETVDITDSSVAGVFIRASLARKTCPLLSSSSNSLQKDVLVDLINSREPISLNMFSGEYHNEYPNEYSNAYQTDYRSEYRKKVKLPITSRITSKVLALANLPLDAFDIIDYYTCSKFKLTKKLKIDSRTAQSIRSSNASLESSICSDQDSSLSHLSSLDLLHSPPSSISSEITAL